VSIIVQVIKKKKNPGELNLYWDLNWKPKYFLWY
jgi:hypothetical protein